MTIINVTYVNIPREQLLCFAFHQLSSKHSVYHVSSPFWCFILEILRDPGTWADKIDTYVFYYCCYYFNFNNFFVLYFIRTPYTYHVNIDHLMVYVCKLRFVQRKCVNKLLNFMYVSYFSNALTAYLKTIGPTFPWFFPVFYHEFFY